MTIMHKRLYTSFSNSTELQIRSLPAAGEGDLERLDIPDGGHFRDLASIQSNKPSSPDIICIAESTMVIVLSILNGEVTDRLEIDLEETGNISTSRKDGYIVLSLPLNQKVLSMNCATGDFVWCLKLDEEATKRGEKNGSASMSPLFTIQMAPGRFLVSDSVNSRICILGLHGEIIHLYKGLNGTGPGALQRPQHMVVDGQNNVLLLETRTDPCDWLVLLLSPNLRFLGVLVRASEGDTREPTKICLDSEYGRLYIGMKDGRVFSYNVMAPSAN